MKFIRVEIAPPIGPSFSFARPLMAIVARGDLCQLQFLKTQCVPISMIPFVLEENLPCLEKSYI